MEIREGMIGFSGGQELLQRAIRFFIDSDFSHSFMVRDNKAGIPCALETTITVVIFEPVKNKLHEKNWVEMWDVIADSQKKKAALDNCMVNLGKWYSYLSYIWFIYRWLMRKFGYEPKVMWKWCTIGPTCTELTQKYPSQLFPELFVGIDPNTISPKELREIMVANPDKFVLMGWLVPRH